MSVDLATLGIKVDASEADQGKVKLDELAKAGDRAQSSTRGLSNSAKALNGDLGSTAGAANAAGASMGSMAGKTSQASGSMSNAAGATGSMAERVSRLRASVDPLGVAIDRVNDELRENEMLYASGAISQERYASGLAVLNARATDLAARQTVLNARLVGGANASRLTADEALNLSRQFADIGVTAAMGMNPLMILIQQGPQIADIMRTSGLGWRGMVREMAIFFKLIEEVPAANAAVAASQGAVATANTAVTTTAVAAATAEQQLSFAFMEAGTASNAAAAGASRVSAANATMAASSQTASTTMITRLGPLARIGGPIALGLLAVAGVFGVIANEAENGLGNVQKEFGFTEAQMKRLKDEGVDTGVTMGDAFLGFYDTVKDLLVEAFGPQIDAVKEFFTGLYNDAVDGAIWAIKDIVGSFVGAYRAVQATWSMLPDAMADVVLSSVNFVIDGVERMVNFSADAINGLIERIPEWARPEGRVGRVSLGRVDNPYQGAASRTVAVGREAYGEGYAEGGAAVDAFGRRLVGNIRDRREARLREAAGEPGRERQGRQRRPQLSEEERDYKRAVDGAENYIKALNEETEAIGKNELEVKRLQTTRAQAEITRAAEAMGTVEAIENARRLTTQMAEAQTAWETATRAEHLRVLRQELGDLADNIAHETSLIGMNNEAREVAIAQREIDIRLRDLERRGWEITPELIQAETDAILANARARGRRADATEEANRMATAMRDNAAAIRDTTEAFGDLFGTAGEGFANLLNTMLDFDARQAESRARLIALQEEYNRGQMSAAEYAFERGRIEDEMARSQISHYGDMLSAAKTFFAEGSTGWRILEGAERAYRIFQFAMQIRAMFMDKAQTASSVANSGARAAADGVAAIAKAIASLPFPLNIAAGAATAAALIAFGVKVLGGGKGASKGAAASAASAADSYNGPRDAYGNPTSYYSVLKPGSTVANDNGLTPGYGGGAGNVGNTIVIEGDKLTIEGGADQRTVQDLEAMLNRRDEKLKQDIRQTAAEDRAAAATRQRIGGGS